MEATKSSWKLQKKSSHFDLYMFITTINSITTMLSCLISFINFIHFLYKHNTLKNVFTSAYNYIIAIWALYKYLSIKVSIKACIR